MKVATRGALVRVGIILFISGIAVFVAWQSMIRMPLQSYTGPLPPLDETEQVMRDRLRADVERLAGAIGERNVFRPAGLYAAADFVAQSFAEAGFTVARDHFTVSGERCENIEVEVPGTGAGREIVVVGAHYDSVLGCPGANDNATGTAGLLALARAFSQSKPGRTLRLVAFVNEEPPYFQAEEMGSLVYARKCRERDDAIVAMLSLETIGYYSDRPGSQRYPFPLRLFYPSRGNFIAFVGNRNSAELVRESIASFRRQVSFPSEGAALPSGVPGVDWSDHWSFWQCGYSAIMVTDTAPFRYAHYHTAEDTPEKIDYDRMARVVSGLVKVIRELVEPERVSFRAK